MSPRSNLPVLPDGQPSLTCIHRESHRIKKPSPLPEVPVSSTIVRPGLPGTTTQYRKPVIIHTYAPRIIKAEPHEFMAIVQRLTGKENCDHGSSQARQVSGEGSRKMESQRRPHFPANSLPEIEVMGGTLENCGPQSIIELIGEHVPEVPRFFPVAGNYDNSGD
ncbi:hypothetical protein AMTRI_Chr04g180010 [Amborella trichopoda]